MSNSAAPAGRRDGVVQPAVALPYRSGRAIRVGAISNPASGKNRKKNRFETVRRVVRSFPEATHFEADQPAEIVAAAQELGSSGVEMILVNGGDGTVQAVITGLFRMTSLARMPLLVLIPGGTTNMIARDVGSGPYSPRGLERLLAGARGGRLDGEMVPRSVIRTDFGAPDGPIFGMFFGAGAVYHGIQYCRQRVHAVGLKGELGPGFAMMVLLSRLVLGRKGDLLPALNAWGSLDGETLQPQEYFGLLVSTLERLFLGLRPYWGDETGPMRYLSVSYWPQHKLRAAPAIMRGKPNRFVRPEFGYVSRRALEIRLHIDSGFTLDGELFDAPSDGSVVLYGGNSAFFLRTRET